MIDKAKKKVSLTYLLKTLNKISGAHSESHCFRKWLENAFTRIKANAEAIATLSVCLYITLRIMKNDSYGDKV